MESVPEAGDQRGWTSRTRAALDAPGGLHDPEGARVAYLTAASILQL